MRNLVAMEKYFWENFDNDKEFSEDGVTLNEACGICLKEYKRIMKGDYHYTRMLNDVERVGDVMRGLPAPFYPEVYYFEIREYLKDWGIAKDEKHAEKLQEDWWKHWAIFIINNAKKVVA